MLAVFRGTDRRDFLADQIGSTRALSDPAGALTDRYGYFAFGGVREHSGSDGNRYLFAGEPFEASRGFSHNRARWFAPEGGRFISVEPLLLEGRGTVGLHAYEYAFSLPTLFHDPTGREGNLASQGAIIGSIGTLVNVARLGAYTAGRFVVRATLVETRILASRAAGAARLNPAIYRNLTQDLLAHGPANIVVQLRGAQAALADHIARAHIYAAQGGYVSQMLGTIRNVSSQVRTIIQFMLDHGITPP
jgi:RHS repeat-associated protein